MSEKGGQGIYRRGDGSWRIVVAAGRDPESGKYVQVRETLKGTKRDAVRRRDELRAQVGRGTVASGGTETVAVFLVRHIDHREAIGKIRPKTASVYRGYVRREIAPRIGILRLTEVRPVHVQRVLDDALASGLSARSVLQVHRIMHAAFRQAIRWQMLAMNPSDGVTPPKAETPDLTTPTAEQISDLLDAVSDAFRPAIAVLAGTGLRRGEVAALRWEGVDLDSARPSLIVSGSMQRADGALRVFPPRQRAVTGSCRCRNGGGDPAARSVGAERATTASRSCMGREGFVFDRGERATHRPRPTKGSAMRGSVRGSLLGDSTISATTSAPFTWRTAPIQGWSATYSATAVSRSR